MAAPAEITRPPPVEYSDEKYTHAESSEFMRVLAAAEPVGEPEWYVISGPDSITVNTVATNVYPCELVRVRSIARAWAEAVARVSAQRSYIAELRNAAIVAGFEITTFEDFTEAMNLSIVEAPLGYDICRVARFTDLTRSTKKSRE